MNIERPGLAKALLRFTRGGHGVILGSPGAGKTHSLRALAREIERDGLPFLWLSVDSLGEATEEDLRLGLGYDGNFVEAITQLFASAPSGLVIVDGFDAARNAAARARLVERVRQLIENSPPQWHVLVSVRNYDASKSPRLLALFGPGSHRSDPQFTSPGVPTRHFLVPELSDDEVASAVEQIAGLSLLYEGSRPEFRTLLRSPFNLWLLERIITHTADPASLGQLASEVQLLDAFWSIHVMRPADDAARRAILTRATEAMIVARQLAVRKPLVYDPAADTTWQNLLSEDLLAEVDPQGERIGFRHNILFDYAVAVLLIDPAPAALAAFIRADTSRPLFLRPSIVYFFAQLWHFSRASFWECFWGLLPAQDISTRLVARLIPPYVLASECRDLTDLEPLLRYHARDRELGGLAIVRTLYALRRVGRARPQLWAAFADAVKDALHPTFAWEMGILLQGFIESPQVDEMTRAHCGAAGRALLAFALSNRNSPQRAWFDNLGAIVALPIVTRTISTAVSTTRALTVRVLDLMREHDFPIRYFYTLADEVSAFFALAPDLASRTYLQVFGHEETSRDPTLMGGIVLPMTSNRRQDFEMCQYGLSKAYAEFLRVAPEAAVPVGVQVLNARAISRSLRPYLREGKTVDMLYEPFQFLGKQRQYLPDHLFLENLGSHEYVSEMVAALEAYLASDGMGIEPSVAVALIAESAVVSSGWGVLLHVGATTPSRYATLLDELATATPILLSQELPDHLATFLRAAWPLWPAPRRERFEQAVLGLIVKTDAYVTPSLLERRIDWLLSILDPSLLVSEAAIARAAAVRASGERPEVSSGPRVHVSSRAFSEDDWLTEQGVQIESPANARLRSARDALAPFVEKWSNSTPDDEAVAAVLPLVEEVLATLRDPGSADRQVVEATWTKLAASADAILRTEPNPATSAFSICREVALRAASFPAPTVPEDRDRDYTWPHWSPTPRTEAIQCLSHLLRITSDEVVVNLLILFASSLEPSERFLVVRYSPLYIQSAPALYWHLMETAAVKERNVAVAIGVLSALGYAGSGSDPRRAGVVQALASAFATTEQRDLRHLIADWTTYFAFYRDDLWAAQEIERAVARLPQSEDMVLEVVFGAALYLLPKRLQSPVGVEVAERAAAWLVALLSRLPPFVGLAAPEASADAFQAAHKIVGRVVDGLHRASRADSTDSDHDGSGRQQPAGFGARQQQYQVLKPVLGAVLQASETAELRGMAAPTAFHLMEMLRDLLVVAPRDTVRTAATVAVLAKREGYHLDSMAVSEMVRLVETVLADYRELFTEGAALADLLTLLDVFADAGWPEALALVWRLDEVFR